MIIILINLNQSIIKYIILYTFLHMENTFNAMHSRSNLTINSLQWVYLYKHLDVWLPNQLTY